MSNLVSVVTPVYGRSIEHLDDAYDSLTRQVLPAGWDWRWIVQEDGETGQVAKSLPSDSRISAGQARHGGPGVARTLALSRAQGSLVKVLDADDILTEGVLARDIAVLAGNPEVGWATSRVLDLHPDGSTTGFDGDPEPGQLRGTTVLDFWRSHNYRAPVHPATLCIRRDLVMALGGWMALPASEDTGLLLAASVVSDGYFTAEPGLLYRKWSGQATSQEAHTHPGEWIARMRIIEARAEALQTLWRRNDVRLPSDSG